MSRSTRFGVPSRFLYIIGLLIPLYSLSINLFVEWSWFKIIPLVLLGGVVLKRTAIYPPKRSECNAAVLLVSYMFLITLFSYVDNYTVGRFQYAIDQGQEPARTYGHMIIQLFVMVGFFLNFAFLTFFVKSRRHVESFVNGFLVGNFVSVVFGCMQFIGGTGEYYSQGRMNGLGGEPRHFAAFLSLALVIIIANYLARGPVRLRGTRFMVPVFLLGLFFSLSSSSWLGFTAAFAILVVFSRRMRRTHKICAVVLVITPMLLASETVQVALDAKVFERMKSLDQFLYFAPKDALVLKLLSEDWRILLVGAGAGGTDSYVIAPQFISSVSPTILRAGIMQLILNGEISFSPSPSSFAIKFAGEYGLLGVLLLVLFIRSILRRMESTPYLRMTILISAAVFVSSMVISIYMVYAYFITISVFYAFAYHNTSPRRMAVDFHDAPTAVCVKSIGRPRGHRRLFRRILP